jgi:hypothetical protein
MKKAENLLKITSLHSNLLESFLAFVIHKLLPEDANLA